MFVDRYIHSAGYVIACTLLVKLLNPHERQRAKNSDSPISIPPAKLPARMDRYGLGGGSFFSEVVAAGVPIAGTEGVAAALVAGAI